MIGRSAGSCMAPEGRSRAMRARAHRRRNSRSSVRSPCRDWLPKSRSHLRLAASSSVVGQSPSRSEEHTSELQSLAYLVCRLLLEKKKKKKKKKKEKQTIEIDSNTKSKVYK